MPKASLLCSLTVALEKDSLSLVSRSGSAEFWGAVEGHVAGGGRGTLVHTDEGGERCQKVLSALVGFLLGYLKPSTTSTVINFYLDSPFLLRKLFDFSSCNVIHVLLTILALLY